MNNINIGRKGSPFIFLTKIGISFIPKNNRIIIKSEKMGITIKSSPRKMIPKREGIPIMLIKTLEDFFSGIV